MSIPEPNKSPRNKADEAKLIMNRYGVAPTPGCQLQPIDIHNWKVTPPAPEPAKVVPNVVTVFGGTGMIGLSLLKRISTKFEKVRLAVRNPEKAKAKISGIPGNIELVQADIMDYDSVEAACMGSGTVINLVGILYETSEATMHKVHYEGAVHVVQAASVAGASHFLHMSAIGAYDQGKSRYLQTKGWAEGAIKAKFPSAVIFKPSVVFGPQDNFFNQFANFPFPFLPVIDGGESKFQPVYVEDVSEAMAKCAIQPELGAGKTFELGGPDVFTFRELMEKVGDFSGSKKPLLYVPSVFASFQGWMLEWMQKEPLLTHDQVRMLENDNVVAAEASTLGDLGISAKSVDKIVPTYIRKVR